jgi:hypothetical protein
VRLELNRLSEAGFLLSKASGKTKIYRANQEHPLYQEIRSIVSKYLGFDRLIEQVVNNLGNVEKAIILGDYAQGKDTGTIELVLIGRAINLDYLRFLIGKTEHRIKRKVIVQVLEVEPESGVKGLVVFDV